MPVQPGRMKMMIDPLILIIKQTEHLIIEDKKNFFFYLIQNNYPPLKLTTKSNAFSVFSNK